MQSFVLFHQSPVLCALLLFHSCTCACNAVGLTSSSAGAAVPLTHSTLQQTTSQAISQLYNTYHQQTELELQQLQFSQYQQPTGVYICKFIAHLKAQFQDLKSYNIHICNFMYVTYIWLALYLLIAQQESRFVSVIMDVCMHGNQEYHTQLITCLVEVARLEFRNL